MGKKLQNGPQGGGRTPTLAPKVCNRGEGGGAIGECWKGKYSHLNFLMTQSYLKNHQL